MRRYFLMLTLVVGVLAGAGHAQTFSYTTDSAVRSMLQAHDGNLYGIDGDGFFSLTPGGVYTVLNSNVTTMTLCLEAPDGTLYGVSAVPNVEGPASIVKATLAGQVTTVATLPATSNTAPPSVNTLPPCPVIASDGNYYGGAGTGGSYEQGFLYQLTPSGKLNVFYNFTGGADGQGPAYSLVEGSDGNLYGLAVPDFFRYSPSLGLTMLYEPNQVIGNTDAPIEGPDGNYYAILNGSLTTGLSKITPAGSASILPVLSPGEPGDPLYQNVFLGGDDRFYVQENQIVPAACGEYGPVFANYIAILPVSLDGTLGPEQAIGGGADSVSGQLTLGGSGYFYAALTNTAFASSDDGCAYTVSYSIATMGTPTTPPAPLAFTLSKTHVLPGGSATLTWQLNNGFSKSMQQCYAYGGWSGKKATSGTLTVTAPTAGSFPYSLVCGGVETGIATLTAGDAVLTSSASLTTVAAGVPVTFAAQITNVGSPAPTGSVKFLYGTQVLGSGTLNSSGMATYTASSAGIPPGVYHVTASYAGDANYGPAKAAPLAITVIAQSKPTLALSTTTPTVVLGQTASFNVTATGTIGGYAPTGNVSFHYGSRDLGSSPLQVTGSTVSGTLFSVSTVGVPPGSYSIIASYPGDGWNAAATSNAVTVQVLGGDSVTVAAAPNPVPSGDGFTLTANVSGKSTPTGTVIFYAGAQALGSNSLNGSGVASVQVPTGTLTAGSYSVTAYYAGDAHNPAATSAAVTLVVQ